SSPPPLHPHGVPRISSAQPPQASPHLRGPRPQHHHTHTSLPQTPPHADAALDAAEHTAGDKSKGGEMEGKHRSCTSSQPHRGPCTAVPLNATHSFTHLSRTITAPLSQRWRHAVTSTSAAALPTQQQRERGERHRCGAVHTQQAQQQQDSSTLFHSQMFTTTPSTPK
ncbi:hypothetical protein DQ04_10281030, partial [Trypanosoma grayi]|uniref:hypothetical protein n=1 Tax=Trypanosoma grayi TaxID=71804 RepID=UPI0004F45C27